MTTDAAAPQFTQGNDGTELFYRVWDIPCPAGTLLITHGQAEHSACYDRLRAGIAPLNLRVIGWDLRGHGRSAGQRGYVSDFSDYTSDFDCIVRHIVSNGLVTGPLYMLGHSLGGLIQMSCALENPHLPAAAMIFSAPFFGLSMSVPLFKRLAAVGLRAILPRLTLRNEIREDLLSRDSAVVAEYARDPLRHDRMSAGAFLGAMARIRGLDARIGRFRYRSLFQIPVADPLCDSAATRRLVRRIGPSLGCVLREYPDRRHEIYNDLGREQAFADLIEFLSSR
jgi:alpha-beta hydrolase superfamily lysophospholipase